MEFSYRFYTNKDCKFLPCHKVDSTEDFNCLFCYCPLYMMEDRCGGNFSYKSGVKDCSNCLIPHKPKGYDYINQKLGEYIMEQTIKNLEKEND